MLYGVSLGPGDKELVTLQAARVLKEVSKVYVPGELAYEIAKNFCKPEILKIPMGKGKEYAPKIAEKLAVEARDRDVAFATLGDIHFFSTFMLIRKTIQERFPDVEIRTIPGVASFVAAFSLLHRDVNKPFLVTTPSEGRDEVVVVLKVKKPREVAEKLKAKGYCDFVLVEKAYMDGERVVYEPLPEKSSYFSLLVGKRCRDER